MTLKLCNYHSPFSFVLGNELLPLFIFYFIFFTSLISFTRKLSLLFSCYVSLVVATSFITGVTGILCSRFCQKVVLTDHNEEVLKILKKNIELHSVPENNCPTSHGLVAEKLEWGNSDQINEILQNHPGGFDFILGADICFQQSSIPLLFDTVKMLLLVKEDRECKFILAYVSRAKTIDMMIVNEALKHGLQMKELPGTRHIVGNLEGVIFEITLH
ncbi:uncharacterized protein LOC129302279 isoform X2 [Prosopis cineraria]|uniref:uncharacterized protein LOC129302279 isoform X2 n=1 Tax=Prosopis cineraria TaxID=364024 RepID=UPI00240F3766|nr:uncharacterized protein LOC129302279 isoform X2 [Prosopis cineraria]